MSGCPLPAPTPVTTPDAACYPTPMAPVASVVTSISAVIAIARVSAVIAVAGIIAIAISVMRIPISVSVVSITPRANVDINLCRCGCRRKHR